MFIFIFLGESIVKIIFGNSLVEFIIGVLKLFIWIGDILKVIRGLEIFVDCIVYGIFFLIINWCLNGSDLRFGVLKW